MFFLLAFTIIFINVAIARFLLECSQAFSQTANGRVRLVGPGVRRGALVVAANEAGVHM